MMMVLKVKNCSWLVGLGTMEFQGVLNCGKW
jgi:hypothetical protein